MKIDKNTANMLMLAIKNTTNNTKYTMQELHTFLLKYSVELHLKFHYKAFHFH